jgi:hypothetical protein
VQSSAPPERARNPRLSIGSGAIGPYFLTVTVILISEGWTVQMNL